MTEIPLKDTQGNVIGDIIKWEFNCETQMIDFTAQVFGTSTKFTGSVPVE